MYFSQLVDREQQQVRKLYLHNSTILFSFSRSLLINCYLLCRAVSNTHPTSQTVAFTENSTPTCPLPPPPLLVSVSVWVGLWVMLSQRQVRLASWLEQVYRLCSHRTDLCTWLQTRNCCVKPLCPFSSVCLRFITPHTWIYLFFPSAPFFQRRVCHCLHLLPCCPILCLAWFAPVSPTPNIKHTYPAMHHRTNSLQHRWLMGE